MDANDGYVSDADNFQERARSTTQILNTEAINTLAYRYKDASTIDLSLNLSSKSEDGDDESSMQYIGNMMDKKQSVATIELESLFEHVMNEEQEESVNSPLIPNAVVSPNSN